MERPARRTRPRVPPDPQDGRQEPPKTPKWMSKATPKRPKCSPMLPLRPPSPPQRCQTPPQNQETPAPSQNSNKKKQAAQLRTQAAAGGGWAGGVTPGRIQFRSCSDSGPKALIKIFVYFIGMRHLDGRRRPHLQICSVS